jgi:hypothetical protein
MSGLMALDVWQECKGRDVDSQANMQVRQYGRKFALQTSIALDARSVLNLPGLPTRWEAFPTDVGARCVSARPEQHESNPLVWFCTAEYTSDYILQDFEDPAFKLPEFEWDIEERQVICQGLLEKVTKTVNVGNSLPRTVVTTLPFKGAPVNSAGQPFDPPPLYDKCDPVLCVEATYPTFDIARAMIFNNSLNSDSFLGADAGQVRCKIKAKRFQWRDQFRWTVNYRFSYRAEGWQLQVLDIGAQYKTASGGGQLDFFHDESGTPFLGLLNGEGGALSDDPQKPTDKAPVFITMIAYPVTPFAPLQIPQLLAKTPTLNQQ